MIRPGFLDVRAEELALTLEFQSTGDCVQYLMDVSPNLVALLADRSLGQREEYAQRLAEALRRYVMADGVVRIPNVTVCVMGRR